MTLVSVVVVQTNTSDKETFLDWSKTINDSNIHTSVYDKRNDFRFPFVNFPCLSGDLP